MALPAGCPDDARPGSYRTCMNDILRALGRALVSLLHPRMLWLTAMPFIVSGLLWGAVIWFGWTS